MQLLLIFSEESSSRKRVSIGLISRCNFMALKFDPKGNFSFLNPAFCWLRLVMIFLSRVLSPLREVRDEALKRLVSFVLRLFIWQG